MVGKHEEALLKSAGPPSQRMIFGDTTVDSYDRCYTRQTLDGQESGASQNCQRAVFEIKKGKIFRVTVRQSN
jgi:hypothetical protein